MNDRIHIQFVKLTDGARLRRFSEMAAGRCLEKRLEAEQPVVYQRTLLLREIEDMLSRETAAAH